MSLITPTDEGSEKDDLLWNSVKHLEFLQYEQSIEQIKPSLFDFPDDTQHLDDGNNFSNICIEVIKDYLHIGLVNESSINGKVNRIRVLLLVWPQFVYPGSYRNHKLYLADLKKIKTLIFRVPEDVFRKYSEGNNPLHDIVAAVAILTPVEEWKLLERAVISSFYHLMFDKATSALHGDIHAWQNYPKDNLNAEWKQMFFICCGPQGLAYLFKRMLKRNWARIARNSTSNDVEVDGYSVFCTGVIFKLLVEWAKQFFKPDGVVKFLEEINTIKPVLSTAEVAAKANDSFELYMSSSKKHRCSLCSYQTSLSSNIVHHMRNHTGETPYVCDVCGSAHKQPARLKEHIIIHHTGDYPYYCKYCCKPFVNRSTMCFHIAVHEKKEIYTFNVITKDQASLMQHMPAHANDPSFDCTVCRKKLDSETALNAHMRNHSKDKPFKCHICGRGFLLESVLRTHYKTHSDSRPVFTCHVCNKNLATSRSLGTHMAAQHGEETKA